MLRPPRPAPTGRCVPVTLEERVQELANRFKRKAAEDQREANRGRAEASYHYGLADAFEVVAAMLGEALTEARKGERH